MALNVHPVAALFPMLSEEELRALADDIRANGLVEPIVVRRGVLLDGRNRLAACGLAGVEPDEREWEGDENEIRDWILSKNLHRRHLSTSQRADIAASLATLPHGGARGRTAPCSAPTIAEAAELLNVSPRLVKDARAVQGSGDAVLIAAVRTGETTVTAAAAQVRERSRPPPEPAALGGEVVDLLERVLDHEADVLDAPVVDGEAEALLEDHDSDAGGEVVELHPDGDVFDLGDVELEEAKLAPRVDLEAEASEVESPARRIDPATIRRSEPAIDGAPLVDLRLAGCEDIAWPAADLVIADPPWSYVQKIGASRAENHYAVLPTSWIVEHLSALADRAPRLVLWLTWPLLAEWTRATKGWPWGEPVTGGAWVKSGEDDSGHYGQGYHWAGCSEPVLVYTSGASHLTRSAPLRNAWIEPPSRHSRKPVEWQTQWIRRWCPEGGLVLDPYAGTGTVAEAVLRAGGGRRYLGTEVDDERHALALQLIDNTRAVLHG